MPDSPPSKMQVIHFGDYEADLRAGELRKKGVKLKIQEQPLQILAMLLEHPGQVVTREELRSRLWPSDTFVDFDHSLNKAINKLREALGDSADSPQFVETLPRRGYRFLASVNGAHEAVPKHGGPIDSIVVFSLANPNPSPDLDYLAVGIPGGIIHSLSQIPGLRVIAWNSVARNRDREEDPLAVGRSVGARAVLIGRIWQRDSKLRLHMDLLDTANGEELWGDQYDRELAELFSVQDEISREVSQRLRLKMTGEAEKRLAKRYTENIEAYQLYVRARRWCEKRSAEGFTRGIEYSTQAIQMDPNYALAYAELAKCISVPCYYGAVDPNIAYPKARTAALRALEIDPSLAEGHEVLATILKNYDWNWADAEREYRCAIALNPNCASAHYHYSYLLAELGRFAEAIGEATEALSREPTSPLLNASLAFVVLHARMYDRCIKQALTACEVDPNMTLNHWTLGVAYEQQGRYSEAIEAYEKCVALGGAVGFSTAFISHAYARSGERGKARDKLRELQEMSKARYVSSVAFVVAYEGLAENELAVQFLNKACENRESNLVLIKVWPHFDNLRDDLRFQEVERRVGLRP
jgi:TolB-like protein/DNA-binding SARP family transcriptional activator